MNDNVINEKLKSLEHQRFTTEQLNIRLSQMFGTDVNVLEYEREECVKNDLPELDNQLVCEINNDDMKLSIDVDLYYLKDNTNNYYITEFCFNWN